MGAVFNETRKHLRTLKAIFDGSEGLVDGIIKAINYDNIVTVRRADERTKLLAPLSAFYIAAAEFAGQINGAVQEISQPYGSDFIRGPNGWKPKDPSKYLWNRAIERYVPLEVS